MWLIDTTTISLHFIEDPARYKYAILSHTWEDGEVTFQDVACLKEARKKPGFRKIQKTCELAQARRLQYAWVDTCCIDKTSSAELTEAINSMYQWYKGSTVCFAYLSDLPNCDIDFDSSRLGLCRWFTRGWTLQELIASEVIEFYDQVWNFKGTKDGLSLCISHITGVDDEIILNSNLVVATSVAKRMSWASGRQTTRVEDMAYCLFGLFDVHLPLIYGEGWKAFIRLQEAIILESSDLSIFAWRSDLEDQAVRGLLAFSPSEFRQCGDIQRIDDPLIVSPDFVITNKGVKIETCLTNGDGDYLMSLQSYMRTNLPVRSSLVR
ncbi:heterokaryon incompatibility protein-domain-containing protein [Cadophora sp. MPI-SDFR-AT-0126]|nr:heterokaryon incompatibility protein-domain-containing protein [Leotiomycetes sp. MPI-SDFR-AT-0126]